MDELSADGRKERDTADVLLWNDREGVRSQRAAQEILYAPVVTSRWLNTACCRPYRPYRLAPRLSACPSDPPSASPPA